MSRAGIKGAKEVLGLGDGKRACGGRPGVEEHRLFEYRAPRVGTVAQAHVEERRRSDSRVGGRGLYYSFEGFVKRSVKGEHGCGLSRAGIKGTKEVLGLGDGKWSRGGRARVKEYRLFEYRAPCVGPVAQANVEERRRIKSRSAQGCLYILYKLIPVAVGNR